MLMTTHYIHSTVRRAYFFIVAQVDHIKSSLASRMLERTGYLGGKEQLLAIDASSRAGSEADMNKSDTSDSTDKIR